MRGLEHWGRIAGPWPERSRELVQCSGRWPEAARDWWRVASGARLSGDQLADVRDVPFADGAALAGQNRGHGDCVTSQGHELNFVARTAAMDVHDGADVPGFQTIGRKVGREHNAFVFLNVH